MTKGHNKVMNVKKGSSLSLEMKGYPFISFRVKTLIFIKMKKSGPFFRQC
jgi:hypothetical protein